MPPTTPFSIITVVCLQRSPTPEEKARQEEKIKPYVEAELTNGTKAGGTRGYGGGIRMWKTEKAAYEWIDFMNTFDPPPVKAIVLTV